MKNNRPVNLNLFSMRFPVTAIASISHRVSGVVLFLSVPMLLWALQRSMISHQTFTALSECLHSVCGKLMVSVLLLALVFHWVAGLRHLLMDMHIGDTKTGGCIGAWSVFVISAVLVLGLGGWIWL